MYYKKIMTSQSLSFPSGTCIIIHHKGTYSGSAVVSFDNLSNPAFLDSNTVKIELMQPTNKNELYNGSIEYIENNVYRRFKIVR